jgi:L-lactate dehydrogenase complex protein LldE
MWGLQSIRPKHCESLKIGDQNPVSNHIQLFVTCIIDTLYPEIGEAVVQVLKKSGVRVDFPADQTCCGQPAYNAGMRAEARRMAQHTIRVFENLPGEIVMPSGSCTSMVHHGYKELFADDQQWLTRAEMLANRTFEFTQYLVDEIGITDFDSKFEGKVTYHPSCHLLRDMGIDRQPETLLSNVSGAEYIQLGNREECCGFGGLFSVEHPEISKEMLDKKINNFINSGSETMVACDAGCMAHISGGLHRRNVKREVLHIAEILAKS